MIINILTSTMLVLLPLSPGGALRYASSINVPLQMQPGSPALQTTQTRKGESRTTAIWSHSEDGVKVEVRIEGKVEFTDDYTDVRSVSEDGLLLITDERGGATRKLRVTLNTGGTLKRAYSVNGQSREFDADASAWLSRILTEAARDGGLDAEVRARRILQQRGARGVLEEIKLLKNDYAKRVYFETLIKEGNPDTASLENILRQTSSQISSDYETARLLIDFAPLYLGKNRIVAPFFDATRRIKSDYEHARVLYAVLKNNPNREVLKAILESTQSISSDYEKAKFLLDAMPLYLDDKSLRSSYLEAIRSITSDYERGRVLTVVSKKTQLN